ncbi:MAG TPA: hypothetical protein VGM05_29135 [Planctomycetaceae bacterium]|jgi:hypothetical protein
MLGAKWLENVEAELSRHSLPRQEVARLVAELSDHVADVLEARCATGTVPVHDAAAANSFVTFTQEQTSMDASVAECLGSPAEIADTAVREFRRRRNLLSRSPLAAFCTFVLLPVPALCLAWAATLAAMLAVGAVLDWCSPDSGGQADATQQFTVIEVFIFHVLFIAVLVLPSAGVSALFGRLARKTSHLWRWGLAASFLVALATAFVFVQAKYSESPEKNMLMFGLDTGMKMFPLTKFGQFLIPLATGVLMLLGRPKPQVVQTSG